nr:serine/threonine-protein kinase srpk [Quercus suber]
MSFRSLRFFLACGTARERCRPMPPSGRWFGDLFGRSYSPPRQIAVNGFKLIDAAEKLEEENWDWYSADAYYPVQIGDTFRSRYQVLGKLGYGAHSTAWLGRDLQCVPPYCPYADRVQGLTSNTQCSSIYHPQGSLLVRQLLDSFSITVPAGEYLFLVHEPLGMSVETLASLMPGKRMSEDVLKSVLKHLLLALDFLHGEGKTVHTANLHFRVEDDSIFRNYERNEAKSPSPRKIDGDRIIYESRGLGLPSKTGPPMLCDFGEARFGQTTYTDDIQPYVYRAPEVILDIPWSYEVDIWNVGVMIWDLFEGQHLFSARGPTGDQSSTYHLAEMCAMLGPPPLDYLRRSTTSWEYFEEDGTWKGLAQIPATSLEALETRLSGVKRTRFLKFIRRMLQWKPEMRFTAKQLLEDPWLKE